MRKILAIIAICAANLVWTHNVYADFTIIVHPSNKVKLDRKAISRIYMGKMSRFPKGEKAQALKLDDKHETSEEFHKKILRKSSAQLNSIWSRMEFTGKGNAPKEMPNEKTLIEYVRNNPSAIGYISGYTIPQGVRVVAHVK